MIVEKCNYLILFKIFYSKLILFICFSFASPNSLFIHRKIHEGNSKFVCEICDKKFVQKINLIHHSHIHQNDRAYQCPQCDRRYSPFSK